MDHLLEWNDFFINEKHEDKFHTEPRENISTNGGYLQKGIGKFSMDKRAETRDIVLFNVFKQEIGTIYMDSKDEIKFDLSFLQKGIYFVKVKTKHGYLTRKLIIK